MWVMQGRKQKPVGPEGPFHTAQCQPEAAASAAQKPPRAEPPLRAAPEVWLPRARRRQGKQGGPWAPRC